MTPQTLFTDGELREHLARARRQAEQTLLDYDPNRLLLSSEADVSDYLVGLGCVDELVLHRDGAYQLEPREISKQSRDQWDHRIRDVRVTRYTVVVPFSGDPTLLGLRANTFTMNTPSAAVHDQELHIEWDSDYGPGTAELIKSHFNDVIDRIEHTLGFLNRDIAEHNKTITNEMSGRVAARRAKHLADKQMQADLGFPLKTRSDAAAYAIPITRRMLAATRPPHPPAPRSPPNRGSPTTTTRRRSPSCVAPATRSSAAPRPHRSSTRKNCATTCSSPSTPSSRARPPVRCSTAAARPTS